MTPHLPDPERIAAYVLGDLDPEETREFERMIERDSALQAEVKAYRDTLGETEFWMRESMRPECTGAESVRLKPHANEIEVDLRRLESPRRRTSPRLAWSFNSTHIVRIAAGLVLFLGGYLLGQQSVPPPVSPQPSPPAREVTTEPASPAKSRFASLPGPIRTTEEDGKLIIETKLSRSGSSAVWVVNGDFGLEN